MVSQDRVHSSAGCNTGAQVELCMLPAFLELLALLPGYHVSMHMIGPGVPEQLHGRACRSGGGVGAVQGEVVQKLTWSCLCAAVSSSRNRCQPGCRIYNIQKGLDVLAGSEFCHHR